MTSKCTDDWMTSKSAGCEGKRRLTQKATVRLREETFTPHWGWPGITPTGMPLRAKLENKDPLKLSTWLIWGTRNPHKATFKHRVEITTPTHLLHSGLLGFMAKLSAVGVSKGSTHTALSVEAWIRNYFTLSSPNSCFPEGSACSLFVFDHELWGNLHEHEWHGINSIALWIN